MNGNLYHYKAYITSVYDGDTCTADIDLGLGVTVKKEK
ncbi:MAG: nuclease, partial [Aestuariibacter sp.]|nr:nuclease [Aestuariibacter sp.]